DPEGQALTYNWNFGDGTTAIGNITQTHEYQKAGSYVATVIVTDVNGLTSQKSVTIAASSIPLPPDPNTRAPILTNKLNPTMEEQISFLYTGPNPIQTGVDVTKIVPDQLIAIRGRILDENGNPLSGVSVRSLNESHFGETLTRADGTYDFAMNAGGNFTMDFTRAGYLKAQRAGPSDPQPYNVMPEVIMKRLDPKVTTIALSAPTAQVAQGTTQTDSDGARTATVIVPANTQGHLVMPDGSTRAVISLNLRVTEFTVGENGPKQMPATLPPRSAYTYAAELSSDEGIALGAEHIQFSKPIAYYVDNFLNIPVGTAVPLGTYDYAKGYWSAQKDGVVVRFVGIENGEAKLDFGNGPATALELQQFNVTAEELRKLAEVYVAGKTLWRISLDRFSPLDLNFMGGNAQSIVKAKVPLQN
ncbi:MAG: PKD domain-containing protein, partial [Proteobacteria bacterium]